MSAKTRKTVIRVALDVSPLYSGHQVRGIGFYTQRLLAAFEAIGPKILTVYRIKKKEALFSTDADLVHLPYFSPFFLTLPFRPSKPLVVTVHDLIPLKYPAHFPAGIKGRLKWAFQKRLLANADAIITDSRASALDIHRLGGVPEQKIKVIYLAADPDFCPVSDESVKKSISKKYNLPEHFALYVGDINWNKNVPGLIAACQKIKLPLVLVGKQIVSTDFDNRHPENQDLVKVQSALKNQSGLFSPGFVPTEDLKVIYALASVYCQPSFDEGFGLPVLEALACGCPVIAGNRGSLPEISAGAALLVNPDNPDDLPRILQKVTGQNQLRAKLARLGIKQAAKFSWGATAENTLKVYRQIINNAQN